MFKFHQNGLAHLNSKARNLQCFSMNSDSFEEDSFDEDEEQELVALTARYVDKSTQKDDELSTVKPSHNNESRMKNQLVDTNAKYLEAIGEIAILREKVRDIEKSKNDRTSDLINTTDQIIASKDQKIIQLESLVKKLEQESRFYIAELKNPLNADPETSGAKKRKYIDPQTQVSRSVLVQNPGSSAKSKPSMRLPDYKSLFIKRIWNCSIPGSSRKSLHILCSIGIDTDFHFESFKIMADSKSIGDAITEYLVNSNDHWKIDEFISGFIKLLVELLKSIINPPFEVVGIPFLLNLLHTSISFRINAVTKDCLTSVISFVSYVANTYLLSLDSDFEIELMNNQSFASQSENPLLSRMSANIQTIIIRSFILVFALDILEVSCGIAAGQYGDSFIKQIWVNEVPVSLVRSCLSKSCPLNCTISMIEAINHSICDSFAVNLSNSKTYDASEFCDKEYIKLLLSVLTSDIRPVPNFFIYGLNRCIGNNEKVSFLDEIVPPSLLLIKEPFPISLRNEKNASLITPLNAHENTRLTLYMKSTIIKLFENTISIDSLASITYIRSPECVKYLVEELRTQQELIVRNPKSEFSPFRYKLISQIIVFLGPLLLEQDNSYLISSISPGVKRQMVVILTRIAFSAIHKTTELSIVDKHRNEYSYQGRYFNDWCEEREKSLQNSKKELKFDCFQRKFSAMIVGLARDILEICITPDEADSLYYAFIAEDEGNGK